jgi:uroporphyrinogen III methyltransferase/synthase
VAREILPEQLRAAGADVRVVTMYHTVRPSLATDGLKDRFRRHEIDVVTFASSSTVRNFCELFENRGEMMKLVTGSAVACIGPITARTAEEEGLTVTILAKANTIPALVTAIVDHAHGTR